jgi:hypothetical protein
MTNHNCPRCGLESPAPSWPERHPFAAAVFGVPTAFTVVSVTLAYPWFFVPMLVIVCALLVNRAARRRAATAARADWEHREMMARAIWQQPRGRPALPDAEQMRQAAWQPDISAVRPRNPAPWHVVTQWPTTSFRKGAR